MVSITFDKKVKKELLTLFDKKVDDDGNIVENSNPKQKVLAVDGSEVNIEEFGGIKKGSEVFIKSDLVSLMKFAKNK